LNHRKKIKAEANQLIPRKPTENLELLFVCEIHDLLSNIVLHIHNNCMHTHMSCAMVLIRHK